MKPRIAIGTTPFAIAQKIAIRAVAVACEAWLSVVATYRIVEPIDL